MTSDCGCGVVPVPGTRYVSCVESGLWTHHRNYSGVPGTLLPGTVFKQQPAAVLYAVSYR
jgi:hypothetical protein